MASSGPALWFWFYLLSIKKDCRPSVLPCTLSSRRRETVCRVCWRTRVAAFSLDAFLNRSTISSQCVLILTMGMIKKVIHFLFLGLLILILDATPSGWFLKHFRIKALSIKAESGLLAKYMCERIQRNLIPVDGISRAQQYKYTTICTNIRHVDLYNSRWRRWFHYW